MEVKQDCGQIQIKDLFEGLVWGYMEGWIGMWICVNSVAYPRWGCVGDL